MWNKIVQGSRGYVKLPQRRNCRWSKLRYRTTPCIHDLKPSPRLSSAHYVRRTLMEAMLQADQHRSSAGLVRQSKIQTTAVQLGDPYPVSGLLLREARIILRKTPMLLNRLSRSLSPPVRKQKRLRPVMARANQSQITTHQEKKNSTPRNPVL